MVYLAIKEERTSSQFPPINKTDDWRLITAYSNTLKTYYAQGLP